MHTSSFQWPLLLLFSLTSDVRDALLQLYNASPYRSTLLQSLLASDRQTDASWKTDIPSPQINCHHLIKCQQMCHPPNVITVKEWHQWWICTSETLCLFNHQDPHTRFRLTFCNNNLRQPLQIKDLTTSEIQPTLTGPTLAIGRISCHKIATWIVGFIPTSNYPWLWSTLQSIILLLLEALANHEPTFFLRLVVSFTYLQKIFLPRV